MALFSGIFNIAISTIHTHGVEPSSPAGIGIYSRAGGVYGALIRRCQLLLCALDRRAILRGCKASAQRVVAMISADKAKTQKYCEVAALGEQIDEASKKKDEKKVDELSQKADEMSAQLGPEFVALMNGLQDLDPNSKDGQEIETILDGLDNLCGKK
jgi:hypothetical protein